jgi:hypothetical protein
VAHHQEGRLSEDFPVPDGLAPGTRVAGYLVEEPLGVGGMAMVYRARDERLSRPVALKVLAPALAADEEFRRRFTAESRAAAAVDHPHIIPVYEAGQAGLALFIAMRLVTGGDLRQVLAREGPLPPERAAVLLSPVASALDAAHAAGLVHRDVKPGNVLVDSAPGRPEHVYLSDFGISKGAASSAGLTGTGQYLGTPDYTSPEQVRGLAVDGRADQYALACVAWHLLTGTVPFQRDDALDVLFAHLHAPPPSLDRVRPGLPAAAGPALGRALAKEPGERYPSCGEFTDALRDALGLPPYRPAVPAVGVARPAAPWRPGTLAAEPDGPTQDVTAPGQRPTPGRGPDTAPGRAARRRRRVTLALGGTLVAAATAVSLLLALPGAAKPPAGAHGGATPTSSAVRTEPAAPSGARTATPAATEVSTQPTVPSRPLNGTLSATLANSQSQGVRAVAFNPDGTTLAVGNFANTSTTYLWNLVTRQIIATLTGTGHTQINAVAFSPDGTAVAAGDFGGDTYVWDTAISRITFTFADPGSMAVDALAYSPDNFTLAVGDGNGCTFLWDTRNGKNAATHCDPEGGGVDAVTFSPNGATLAVGAGTDSTYLWSTATGKLTATLTLATTAAQVQSVAFAPDNTTLAAGDINGRTYLWDTATGKVTATLTDPGSKGVNSVAFSPDGTSLAVGDINGRTYLWDIATGKITATLHNPNSQGVLSVARSPSGGT